MGDSVRVLSTLALAGAVQALAETYEAKSGARIDADFAPTLRLLERLKEGETADVLILTSEGLAGLISARRVVAESRVDLARSWVGLAVKTGESHPDISTEAALRATLLKARSVAYSGLGASGIFFAQLIAKMGIEKEVNARASISPMGFTAERIVTGEADVAIQQLSEL
jgi:molybdate transport system substrate-binding protein